MGLKASGLQFELLVHKKLPHLAWAPELPHKMGSEFNELQESVTL